MIGGVELGALRQLAEPQRTAEAAKQFEALLVEHLLKTMRQATQSDQDSDRLSGSETYLDMAEQQLARALAERGGLGIARMVLKHIQKPGIASDKLREGV